MAPLSRHRTKQYLELLVAPLMLRKERHTSADSKFARTSEMSNGGQGERRSSRCRKTSISGDKPRLVLIKIGWPSREAEVHSLCPGVVQDNKELLIMFKFQ
ncbi:hypothetical protein PC120_g15621 [Phytophthora cactorum]|nr:hypothetical protein PC120_g15621 [Phytophthora cactorum]